MLKLENNKKLLSKIISESDQEIQFHAQKKKKTQTIKRSNVEDIHPKKQPVLVGTVSIEKSEHLSQLLTKQKIEHKILNAKHHQREAKIVSQTKRLGNVTIATNITGRNTDIIDNIGTTTCHVSGNCHTTESSYLQDNLRLTLVMLSIEYLILDPPLCQQL